MNKKYKYIRLEPAENGVILTYDRKKELPKGLPNKHDCYEGDSWDSVTRVYPPDKVNEALSDMLKLVKPDEL